MWRKRVPEQKRLWAIDPTSRVALLTVSLPPEGLRQLVEDHELPCCRKCLRSPASLVRLASRMCSEESHFARAVEARLRCLHSDAIVEIHEADQEHIVSCLQSGPYIRTHVAEMLAGLLLHADETRHNMGVHLAHWCIVSGLHAICEMAEEAPPRAAPVRSGYPEWN